MSEPNVLVAEMRKADRTKEECISFLLLQPEPGSCKTTARRTFQQCTCEQDDVSNAQSIWDRGSSINSPPKAQSRVAKPPWYL